jgi:hypothetical protein
MDHNYTDNPQIISFASFSVNRRKNILNTKQTVDKPGPQAYDFRNGTVYRAERRIPMRLYTAFFFSRSAMD